MLNLSEKITKDDILFVESSEAECEPVKEPGSDPKPRLLIIDFHEYQLETAKRFLGHVDLTLIDFPPDAEDEDFARFDAVVIRDNMLFDHMDEEEDRDTLDIIAKAINAGVDRVFLYADRPNSKELEWLAAELLNRLDRFPKERIALRSQDEWFRDDLVYDMRKKELREKDPDVIPVGDHLWYVNDYSYIF